MNKQPSFSVKSTKWSLRKSQESATMETQPVGSYYFDTKPNSTARASNFATLTTNSDVTRKTGSAQGLAIRSVPSEMEDNN